MLANQNRVQCWRKARSARVKAAIASTIGTARGTPLPGIVIMSPKDENELRQMVYSGLEYNKPVFIRYPKEQGVGVKIDENFRILPLGKSEIIKKGKDGVIFAVEQWLKGHWMQRKN